MRAPQQVTRPAPRLSPAGTLLVGGRLEIRRADSATAPLSRTLCPMSASETVAKRKHTYGAGPPFLAGQPSPLARSRSLFAGGGTRNPGLRRMGYEVARKGVLCFFHSSGPSRLLSLPRVCLPRDPSADCGSPCFQLGPVAFPQPRRALRVRPCRNLRASLQLIIDACRSALPCNASATTQRHRRLLRALPCNFDRQLLCVAAYIYRCLGCPVPLQADNALSRHLHRL